MSTKTIDPLLSQIISGTIHNFVNGFLLDRKSKGVSKNTITLYTLEMGYFCKYLDQIGVIYLDELSPNVIRMYLLELSTHRNQGGVHCAYRVIKSLLLWYESEYEPENWKNPIHKVKIPAPKSKPLPGINIEQIQMMVDHCTTRQGKRDRAILLCLLDSGCRGSEFTGIDMNDVNLLTGEIVIRKGKGGKTRMVYLGSKSKRVLRSYLRTRDNLTPNSPLFATVEGDRLTFSGLRQIIRRIAERTGIVEPGLHDFRRACALSLRRNGCDLLTISRILGHSSLSVTQRYLAIVDLDIAIAYRKYGPVDNSRM